MTMNSIDCQQALDHARVCKCVVSFDEFDTYATDKFEDENELKERIMGLKKALASIKSHMDIVAGDLSPFSTIYKLAKDALEK